MYPTSILMPLICLDASEAQGYRRFWRWHPDALAHWYTHLEGDAWYKHIGLRFCTLFELTFSWPTHGMTTR